MSVPGVGSDAAKEVQERPAKEMERKVEADTDAEQMEQARLEKREAPPSRPDSTDPYHSNDEAWKLESGAFPPHAYPHINFEDGTNTKPNGDLASPYGKGDPKQMVYRTFGRGGVGRRPSMKDSEITSEAAELARAEAASWAQMTPLIAATLGPLSVMLGIPTLTQRWRGQVLDPPVLSDGTSNFQELPDPPLNLVLAGIALLCEVAGNALLVLRFSNFHTKISTYVSYAFWMAKVVFGLANYIEFGIKYPETDDIIYLSGFWVGVCGMGVTIIILVFLTFNLAFLHRQSKEETRRLHHVQREFMMQTLIFFLFTGIAALIFSRVEGTSYVNGIYYMVVTTLTIGFGDVTPHTAVMKVLTFPFTIIGITLLALIVTSIVKLLADRARRRKMELKKRLKKKASEKKRIHAGYGSKLRPWAKRPLGDGPRLKRSLTLQEELQNLREDDWKRERRANLKSMATGFTVFLIFWFIGALVFHFVEPWGYGNALYFCYMQVTTNRRDSHLRFFLTIGYGDFAPNSEAGRPIFIVYALLAVPTMTIIVETVTTNFTAFTMQRVHHKKTRIYQEKDFEIQSMTSLVKTAKEKTCERIDTDKSDTKSVHLPIHNIMERLTEGLQQMHHHLQSLLMQKLGPEARNIIAAERARQSRAEREKLDEAEKKLEEEHRNGRHEENGAITLADLERNVGDELDLLIEYREQYAAVLADLLVAKENLLRLEKVLGKQVGGDLRRRLSDEISELGEEDLRRPDWKQRRRKSSTSSIGGTISFDERLRMLSSGRS